MQRIPENFKVGPNQRLEGEPFKNYRNRLKAEKMYVNFRMKRGRGYFWPSFAQGTYRREV